MPIRRNPARLICCVGLVLFTACQTQLAPSPQYSVILPPPGQIVDLDSIRAQLDRIPHGGSRTRMREALTPACSFCGTAVTITAYPDARAVNPYVAPLPGRALLVATLINVGPYPTKMYNLQPSSVVPLYIVYVVNDAMSTGFEIRAWRSGGRGTMPLVASGKVKGCRHKKYPYLEGDFRDCEWPRATTASARPKNWQGFVSMTAFAETSGQRLPVLDEAPAWIPCDPSGCCTL